MAEDLGTARIGCDVVAGVLPGTPIEELTRRWWVTSEEWGAADGTERTQLLCDIAGKASAYATFLMLQPDQHNWVKTEWIWF